MATLYSALQIMIVWYHFTFLTILLVHLRQLLLLVVFKHCWSRWKLRKCILCFKSASVHGRL